MIVEDIAVRAAMRLHQRRRRCGPIKTASTVRTRQNTCHPTARLLRQLHQYAAVLLTQTA